MSNKEYNAVYYQQNKEAFKAYRSEYYQRNKDKIKKQNSVYKKANKEKEKEIKREKARAYYQKNKDRIQARNRKWWANNTGRIAVHRKLYPSYNRNSKLLKHRWYEKHTLRFEGIKLYYGCSSPHCKWEGQFHPAMLDFHHIDKTGKTANVGMLRGKSAYREMNKCCVVCTNCHREITCTVMDCSTWNRCNVTDKGEIIGLV